MYSHLVERERRSSSPLVPRHDNTRNVYVLSIGFDGADFVDRESDSRTMENFSTEVSDLSSSCSVSVPFFCVWELMLFNVRLHDQKRNDTRMKGEKGREGKKKGDKRPRPTKLCIFRKNDFGRWIMDKWLSRVHRHYIADREAWYRGFSARNAIGAVRHWISAPVYDVPRNSLCRVIARAEGTAG